MGTKVLGQGITWASLVAALVIAGSAGSAVAAPPAPITVKPIGGDHTTIQAAIDAAAPGATIHVYPGNYLETASGRTVLDGTPGANGPHQFGLFVGQDRGGITIQGVDEKGRPIRSWSRVQAHLTTNATNNFGHSGIFVEGDGVTIAGLDIGTNLTLPNKTIEVIGDAFTMLHCDVSDVLGSVYVGDWRFDVGADTSHIRRYRIEWNNFQDGASIDLANGAGYSGDVRNRSIRFNTFANSWYWPSISFNGSDTGVPWFVHSVGGAVIKNNSFVNTFVPSLPSDLDTSGHIRARGTYDNSQFDWRSYWNDNRYNRAFVVGPKPPSDLRTYSYLGYYGTIYDVRRIGTLLEGEQAHQEPGDKILSK